MQKNALPKKLKFILPMRKGRSHSRHLKKAEAKVL